MIPAEHLAACATAADEVTDPRVRCTAKLTTRGVLMMVEELDGMDARVEEIPFAELAANPRLPRLAVRRCQERLRNDEP